MKDSERNELLDRNRANLETGLVKARRVMNAAKRGNDASAHEAMESLVIHFVKQLDDDAREQLVVNALMAAVQIQDELTACRAFSGNRQGRR